MKPMRKLPWELNELKITVICICLIFGLQGCIFLTNNQKAKTPQEKALDDHFYILNSQQKKILKTLQSQEEIDKFFDKFWQARDPSPGTAENELKDEYYRRLEYATIHYIYPGAWKRADERLRVFLIYGPPDQIDYHPFVPLSFRYKGESIKSIEIWLYDEPAQASRAITFFDDYYPRQKKFVFADKHGLGLFEQIFSTENMERIDPKMMILEFE